MPISKVMSLLLAAKLELRGYGVQRFTTSIARFVTSTGYFAHGQSFSG
jgi:hypothetical protein